MSTPRFLISAKRTICRHKNCSFRKCLNRVVNRCDQRCPSKKLNDTIKTYSDNGSLDKLTWQVSTNRSRSCRFRHRMEPTGVYPPKMAAGSAGTEAIEYQRIPQRRPGPQLVACLVLAMHTSREALLQRQHLLKPKKDGAGG